MTRGKAPSHFAEAAARARLRESESIARALARFQGSSNVFDDVASQVLALERRDVPCMTVLLFGGPATAGQLATGLHAERGAIAASLKRLEQAGYVRVLPDSPLRMELTEPARTWIERIWAPKRKDGAHLLSAYSAPDLALIARFLRQACEIQDGRMKRLRTWLASPSSSSRVTRLRGGLSPAALRRVRLFVEANLARPIHLHDLAARAALSPYHFARAFKASTALTPRVFVEHRRIERAKRLLAESALSLADVALESGLGTQSRLTTTFKRRTGFTPGEYRRGR